MSSTLFRLTRSPIWFLELGTSFKQGDNIPVSIISTSSFPSRLVGQRKNSDFDINNDKKFIVVFSHQGFGTAKTAKHNYFRESIVADIISRLGIGTADNLPPLHKYLPGESAFYTRCTNARKRSFSILKSSETEAPVITTSLPIATRNSFALMR